MNLISACCKNIIFVFIEVQLISNSVYISNTFIAKPNNISSITEYIKVRVVCIAIP